MIYSRLVCLDCAFGSRRLKHFARFIVFICLFLLVDLQKLRNDVVFNVFDLSIVTTLDEHINFLIFVLIRGDHITVNRERNAHRANGE